MGYSPSAISFEEKELPLGNRRGCIHRGGFIWIRERGRREEALRALLAGALGRGATLVVKIS